MSLRDFIVFIIDVFLNDFAQNELVNVGTLHCRNNDDFCDKLGVASGLHFYPSGEVAKGNGIVS